MSEGIGKPETKRRYGREGDARTNAVEVKIEKFDSKMPDSAAVPWEKFNPTKTDSKWS